MGCYCVSCRLSLAEYHEQEEIFKLRIGHLKKVPANLLEKGVFSLLATRFSKSFGES